ncbi:MEDS domain-containing protein [Actinomadura sp. 9N407]|uniref:MEDS domain-containing protein n=1 Tax=Actinomadura sp. 9N407 TaxID=3375154 RepID=UPI00379B1705
MSESVRWASDFRQAAYPGHDPDDLDGQAMETSWFAKRPVSSVRPGDHGWLAYSGAEERDLVIGTFIEEGLRTGEKVVYVTDTPPDELPGMAKRTSLDVSSYLSSQQLKVIPLEVACLDSRGAFVPDKLLETLGREVDLTFGQGFRAARLTTDHSRMINRPGRYDLGRMLGCEHRFGDAVSPSTMAMAICQIARQACPPGELAALRATHEVLIEVDPEFDDGILKIVRTFEPHGLRLEGELDDVRHARFSEALTKAALARTRREIHLDFAELGFIDLSGLTLLAQHATRLDGDRELVLDHLPPNTENLIELVGWHRLPGLSRGRERDALSAEGRTS